MKPVSEAYKQSMKNNLRNRSYVEITFGNIDTTAAGDASYSATDPSPYSTYETIDYAFSYDKSYMALELNRTALDGRFRPVPSNSSYNDGYIGNGDTETITVQFTETHLLPGLTLVFDTRAEWFPSTVTVEHYALSSLVETQQVTPTSPTLVLDPIGQEVDKLIIKLNGSNIDFRRARLEKILFGVEKVYKNSDIVSSKQSHDVDPITRRLPNEKLEFSILDFEKNYDPDNPSGIYVYVDVNSPISIKYGYEVSQGIIEWLRADNYIMTAKPKVSNNRATFNATGLIGSMSRTFYKSKLGRKNFYDMAIEVLVDAELTPASDGSNPWEVDESLKTMYTTAVLPIDTHMNCLQLIAHACRCRLYTDDRNVIHIKPFNINEAVENKTDFVLDFNTIKDKSQAISKIDQLKAVTVAKYSYVAANTAETIYEVTTTETQLNQIEFPSLSQEVQIEVTGGSLLSSAVYGRAADLTLSSGTKTIKITGKSLSENSVVVTYPVSKDGEVDKEENPLITEDDMCNALAEHIKNYLKFRNTYDATYRGNPELEVGDVLTMQTNYTAAMDGLVLTDEISFNGSLSGNLKVKGLV